MNHTDSPLAEVNAVVGDGRVAIEIKAVEEAKSRHTKGLKAFSEDYPEAKLYMVTFDKYRRTLNGVSVVPAMEFLSSLWKGEVI